MSRLPLRLFLDDQNGEQEALMSRLSAIEARPGVGGRHAIILAAPRPAAALTEALAAALAAATSAHSYFGGGGREGR